MTILDFAFACSLDESPPYFTYEKMTMLIIDSKENATQNINGFLYIEPFIESLISHESVHVIIKKIEGADTSDSLDDMEVIVERDGSRFQVTLNNMLFAKDRSGIVI
jgi:hypothetical protein